MSTVVADNGRMAKAKKTTDRHKPGRMVRVKEALAKHLDEVVYENASDFTAEVNRAVRELLAREGKWPPPRKAQP